LREVISLGLNRKANHDFCYPFYKNLAATQQVFSSIYAADDNTKMNLGAAKDTQKVNVQMVSGDFFSVLGVVPLAGRFIEASDDKPGNAAQLRW